MRNWSTLLILTVLATFLIGCGTGRTMVLNSPSSSSEIYSSTISLLNIESSVDIPDIAIVEFEEKLNKYLYKSEGFNRGNELQLKCRFIQFDKGDQFTRWFWGGLGNAGEGSLTIEAIFLSTEGEELAKIHSEGRIGSGFFGGEFSNAIDKAAKEIAEYAVSKYKIIGLKPAIGVDAQQATQ